MHSVNENSLIADLIRIGKVAAQNADWSKAVKNFRMAFRMLPVGREREILAIDHLASAYICLCDFVRAARLTYQLGELHKQRTQNVKKDEEDIAIAAKILFRRGWAENLQGYFSRANYWFEASRYFAEKVGDPVVVANTRYFQYRVAVESHIGLLFPGLPMQPTKAGEFEKYLYGLEDARIEFKDIGEVMSQHSNLNADAKSQLIRGKSQAMTKLANESFHFFKDAEKDALSVGTATALAAARTELARGSILYSSGNNALIDVKTQLQSILSLELGNTQHTKSVAEPFLLLAYCELLLGEYSRDDKVGRRIRRWGVDACRMVQTIFPYPKHPLYSVAATMEKIFLGAMGNIELGNYRSSVGERIGEPQNRDGEVFSWLDNFSFTRQVSYASDIKSVDNQPDVANS